MNTIKHKILIVDDRPENIYSLESMLDDKNREILKAHSGEEALKIAFCEDLSLILLDVQMPEMDGFEVAHMLKSTNRTRKIPIIFVTALSKEKNYLLKGLGEGAVDYLFKPLDTEITRAKVETLLQFYSQQKELEQKNSELARLNEEKNYFMGVVSHDLRNPLGNIITLASFIQEEANDSLTDDHKHYLEIIMSSGRHLIDMLNTLLDLTKIESGLVALELKPIHINDIIQHVIGENKFTAFQKNISIEFSYSDHLPTLMIDPMQIQQVLTNLVSNAIKYSRNDTHIELTAEKREEEIIISVKDQGQGIPEQELSGIFTPFFKSSVKSTAGEKSTGLGLTIAQKVIAAHGGKIWVKSQVGIGSTFCFSLPLIHKTEKIMHD